MEGRGQNIIYNAGEMTGQAQMKKEEWMNQASNPQNSAQGTNFVQRTGEQVKNMAQGAARGAANVAQGAADAVKNTLGMNTNNTSNTNTNHPSNPTTRTNYPTTRL